MTAVKEDSIDVLGRIYALEQRRQARVQEEAKVQKRVVRWRRLLIATLALLALLTVVRYGQQPKAPAHSYEDQVHLQRLIDSIR